MTPGRHWTIAGALYAGITVVYTFPLIVRLGSHIVSDPGDPLLNTWILWWNAEAVPLTERWWNAPMFYPAGGAIAFSEHLLGLAPLTTPIIWLTGSPALAYNVAVFTSYPLCALGGYALGYALTRRADAAFVAGLAFAFSPYRVQQLPHLQVLVTYGMPLALLGLHRFGDTGARPWLVVFGAGWLLQAACNGYFLLYFSVLVALWVAYFFVSRGRWRETMAVGVAWVVAALPLVPILLRYRRIHDAYGFTRDPDEMRAYSADVLGLFAADNNLALWSFLDAAKRAEGDLFPGAALVALIVCGLVAALWRRAEGPAWQRWLGWTLTVIAVAAVVVFFGRAAVGRLVTEVAGFRVSIRRLSNPAVWALLASAAALVVTPGVRAAWRRRSPVLFYLLAACLTWLATLGPRPIANGEPVGIGSIYGWLMILPGFDAVRVPARFFQITALCLAAAAAPAVAWLARGPRARRHAVAAIAAAGVLADGWVWTYPTVALPERWPEVEARAAGPLAEVPLRGSSDLRALYRGMFHEQPLVNGYSGHFPPHYDALAHGIERFDPGAVEALAAMGIDRVVLPDDPSVAPWAEWVTRVTGRAPVRAGGAMLVEIPKTNRRLVPPRTAPPLRIAAIHTDVAQGLIGVMLDGDYRTRWSAGPQRPGQRLAITLERRSLVEAVELALGDHPTDFPRRLVVEVSDDAVRWNVVRDEGTAFEAVAAALRAPREVPLQVAFAPVAARFVRLRQMGTDPDYWWSVTEVSVFGTVAGS